MQSFKMCQTPVFHMPKAIPHNSTRADGEKIWIRKKALFRRQEYFVYFKKNQRICEPNKPGGPTKPQALWGKEEQRSERALPHRGQARDRSLATTPATADDIVRWLP